jgi:transcriptional regulator with XRE-family HTH domain
VAEKTYAQWEGGYVTLRAATLSQLAKGLGVTRGTLARGLGLIEDEELESEAARAQIAAMPLRLGPYRIVPTAIRASGGPHGWALNGGALPISGDLVSGRELIAITVSGDCMAPELNDGEIAIVDVGRKDPRPGQIVFVSSAEEDCLVKRYDVRADGPALCDNAGREYRPNGTRLEGTVVGSFRTF